MDKVILKPGDEVLHKSLGRGVVVCADEEFCTVKFEAREAMFRLPDAFEEGFLTSDDAEIIAEEEEIEDDELDEELVEEEGPDAAVRDETISSGLGQESHTKKGISASQVIVAIIMGIFFIPIGYVLFSIGKENFDEVLGGLFTIVGVIFMLAPLFAFIPGLDRASSHSSGSFIGSSDMLSSEDTDSPKSRWLSDEDSVRRDIYAKQDEDLSILEDMIQMHSANPDADLEEHYGWDHKIDFDQDGENGGW